MIANSFRVGLCVSVSLLAGALFAIYGVGGVQADAEAGVAAVDFPATRNPTVGQPI
jgi:hypothetical protein